MKLSSMIIKRFSNMHQFNNFKDFKNHMDQAKPNLCVMYFNADWNPKYLYNEDVKIQINKFKNSQTLQIFLVINFIQLILILILLPDNSTI